MADERSERFSHAAGIAMLSAGLLAGPLAWFTNLEVSFTLVGRACARASLLGLHLVNVAAFLVTAAGGVLAWRAWTEVGPPASDEGGGPIPRTRFLAAVGLLVSALFGLVIVLQWTANLVLDPCR